MQKASEPTIRLTLTQEGRRAIDAPVNGRGGAQDVLNQLKKIFGHGDSANVGESVIGKIARVANNGKGGFQSRLKRVLDPIVK